MNKKIILLLIFYCFSINVFACSCNKAIFNDGKDGENTNLKDNLCMMEIQ